METRGKKRYFISSFVALVLLCSLILIINSKLVTAGASAPDFYYYSSGRKIALPLSEEMVAVRFKQGVGLEQQRAIVEFEQILFYWFKKESQEKKDVCAWYSVNQDIKERLE